MRSQWELCDSYSGLLVPRLQLYADRNGSYSNSTASSDNDHDICTSICILE
jgi:hypothetical protein